MNEPKPHPSENDPKDKMIKKDLKELKSLPIRTNSTFLFSASIIGTSWLSMFYLEQTNHVGRTRVVCENNFHSFLRSR